MFKEEIYQEAMNSQGFTICPLLDKQEVDALKDLYLKSFDDDNISGMFATHNRNNATLSKFLSQEIVAITKKKLDKFFSNYHSFVAHFVVKSENAENEFSLHQDWNIVDEKDYKSYHIWIPLSFTSPHNGGMFVLPKSHLLFKNERSGSFGTPAVASKDLPNGMLKDLNIPTSHALVWNDATFHGSHSNLSDEKRISVVLVIHEKNAPTAYSNYDEEKGCLEKYPLSADDLLENLEILEKGAIPKAWKAFASSPYTQFKNSAINASVLEEKWKRLKDKTITNLPVLRDHDFQLQMETNGYAILPFLSEEEVEKAKIILDKESEYAKHLNAPRYTSLELENEHSKNSIHKELRHLFAPGLDRLFKNYKTPIFQFFIKMPKSDGEVGMHTDSSLLLNPALEPHYGLWIPLIDVDENNGGLKVVRGSHNWYAGFLTSSFNWPFFPYLDDLKKNAKQLKLKAGQLVVFDNRMIHGSCFNNSNEPRIAVAGRITHEFSSYYSFLQEREGFVSVFEEKEDIYLNDAFKGDRLSAAGGNKIGEAKQPTLNNEIFNFE